MNFCKQFFVEKDLQEQLELLRTHSAKKEDICNLAIDTTGKSSLSFHVLCSITEKYLSTDYIT